MPVELALSTEEDALIVCTPTTKAGKPAKVDGPISFSTNNPDATVTQQGDTSALITSPTTAGDVVVTVSADADLGAGVTTISDTVILHVADPQAASLGLAATAQPKPAQP